MKTEFNKTTNSIDHCSSIFNPLAISYNIFLNPTNVDYKNDYNFRFWQCGDVINNVEDLKTAMDSCFENFKVYEPIQSEITQDNFHTEEGSTASERAAKSIIEYLDKEAKTL